MSAIALATLGCKVNQAENDCFAEGFAAAGMRIVDFDVPADAYVINSCTVTHVADRKSRQLIRQARRANPAALVVATGCYAAVTGPEMKQLAPVDLVVPNEQKAHLVQIVLDALDVGARCFSHYSALNGHRTRAFVKVQDGCDSVCAFCVIPYARGRERSVPIDEIVNAVLDRAAAGYREVLLTGVHLGTYGRDLHPPARLHDLLEAILTRSAIDRLRLSSIEPWSFDPAILDLWSSRRLCRHFHLALQSGCDATLKQMRRPYTVDAFKRLMELVRARVPDLAITTDVIVGFPGETDAEFAASVQTVAELEFAAVHVFPYSPRRRTAASKMADQVALAVKRERVAAMLEVANTAASSFRHGFLGRTLAVLYEQKSPTDGEGVWQGLTDNYLRLRARSGVCLHNTVKDTQIIADDGSGGLWGEIDV